MRFPSKFDGHDTEKLPVKLVDLDETGSLSVKVFANMTDFRSSVDLNTVIGPFADRLNDTLCIRFESKAACEMLSF